MIYNTNLLIKKIMHNLKEINIAIDCTCGNGYDSQNIIEILNPKKLYCFDIQKIAIDNTKNKLANFNNEIEFILDTHSNINAYIKENIDFAIFNLGYLPKYDHNIKTNYNDVILALDNIINKMNINATIVITFYPGHNEGKKEAEYITKYLSKLDQKIFAIIRYDFINQINNPPFVISINKYR